jgi:hypothetical protein
MLMPFFNCSYEHPPGFDCNNLALSWGDQARPRHTRFITGDLPLLIQSAVGKLMERWHHQNARHSVTAQTYRSADTFADSPLTAPT